MPTGIYIDHGNGNIVDITQRFATFKSFFSTNGAVTGQIIDAGMVGKKLFFVVNYVGTQPFNYSNNGVPIEFDSTTGKITWDYRNGMVNASTSEPYRYHKVYYGGM